MLGPPVKLKLSLVWITAGLSFHLPQLVLFTIDVAGAWHFDLLYATGGHITDFTACTSMFRGRLPPSPSHVLEYHGHRKITGPPTHFSPKKLSISSPY